MSEQPKRVGDYEILNELGRGGMGRVYRVRHVITDRVEAMKILLPELAGREELVARFLREIKLLASLNHPNIGALRTALTADDQLVMIMEFVEGTTLEERLEQGPVPVAEAMEYADQVLKALGYAHKRGVVHRDIKPANMMLTHDGVIKVMDFGVAFVGTEQKLTSTGTTIGSLPYMSPEQVRGESADPRSDLYSLGVSLYEMVTGRRPFSADSDFAIMIAHVKETPRPPIELQPGLPERLNAIILHALAKEKEGRFQTADEFREALKGGSVAAPAPEKTAVFTPAFPVPAAVRSSETVLSQSMPAVAPAQASAPAPAPAAAPIAAPAPPVAQAPPRSSNRGLYMALGGVLAIVMLLGAVVVAGMYYRSRAGSRPEQAAPPASSEEPAAARPAAAQPAPESTATPAQRSAPVAQKAPANQVASVDPAEERRKAAEAAAAAALEAERQAALAELEKRLDNLTARAFAVDSSLETMRAQQQRAGYDLRGDVATNWASMKFALKRAQDAWEKGDPLNGKKYADQAENHLRQLEKFLGR